MNTCVTPDLSTILATTRAQLYQSLDPLIPVGSACALLDFPNHSNVGDSAIWLGEIAYLKRRNCRIRYVCDEYNYNPHALRDAVGSNTILIHGGGNFGDLWPQHQKLLERVVRDFPDNRIIQLPQSIHFSEAENLEHSRTVFSQHQDFHLLVRDAASLNFARQHYSNSVYLCPDMALMLDLQPLSSRPKTTDVVILSRTDKEKASSLSVEAISSSEHLVVDWLEEPVPSFEWLYHWAHRRLGWNSKVPRSILNQLVLVAANAMAHQRLARGLDILGQGNVVVTDRLHAMILGWLGKNPVFFVDNSYGKLSNLVETWLQDDKELKQCPSFEEAIENAKNGHGPGKSPAA